MSTDASSRAELNRDTVAGAPQPLLSELLGALQAVRDGDFSVRLSPDRVGLEGKIADTFNEIVRANARMAAELERVGAAVGRQGRHA